MSQESALAFICDMLGEASDSVDPQLLLRIVQDNEGNLEEAANQALELAFKQADTSSAVKTTHGKSSVAPFVEDHKAARTIDLTKDEGTLEEARKKWKENKQEEGEGDLQTLNEMFPHYEVLLLNDIYEGHDKDVDSTIEYLLQVEQGHSKEQLEGLQEFANIMDELLGDDKTTDATSAYVTDLFVRRDTGEEGSTSSGPSTAPAFTFEEFLRREEKQLKQDEEIARRLLEQERDQIAAELERQKKDEEMARALQENSPETKRRKFEGEDEKDDFLLAKFLQEEEEEELRRKREEDDRKMAEQLEQEMRAEVEYEKEEPPRNVTDETLDTEVEIALDKETARAREQTKRGLLSESAEIKAKFLADHEFNQHFLAISRDMYGYFEGIGMEGDIKKIQKIAIPKLVDAFERKRKEIATKRGEAYAKPTIAFHGTDVRNIVSILSKGLLVPGKKSGIDHKTDDGWYGKGIYLSPDVDYAMSYSSEGKILVCAVLRGLVYECTHRMDGGRLKKGYDSHSAEEGQEIVIFDAAQVLPCYLVHVGR